MFGVFWEFRQQANINEAHRQARQSETAANQAARRVADLEDRVDRLTLICAAMWSLLQERTGMTDERLLAEIEKIDLSDGKLDGRLRRDILCCPKCNRTMARRHLRCIYCGEQAQATGAFDNVL